MLRPLDCLFDAATDSDSENAPVHLIRALRPDELVATLAALPPEQSAFLKLTGFAAKSGTVQILPLAADGRVTALLGLGETVGGSPFGALPYALPALSRWRLAKETIDPDAAALGFCLGAYRYSDLKSEVRRTALLEHPMMSRVGTQARAIWMARDLVNTPANLLGPEELSEAVVTLAQGFGAKANIVAGEELSESYPAIAAVGRGSDRKPRVAILRWRGRRADEYSPKIALCGKGVCFDSGGYDLKPSSSMLRMKKDMGGAAVLMAVAAVIMADNLPIEMTLRIGCVENSVSGSAMRPLDVLRTRSGMTVEVGNTDAEGRLVLCDLLTDAVAEEPDFILDAATLTGAARAALGPDIPALFSSDEKWTHRLLNSASSEDDPLWQLPLWAGYEGWLDSGVADMNNVSASPLAGAIIGALFLKRFVPQRISWAHVDLYAWNDTTRPARPEGGEAPGVRSIAAAIRQFAEESYSAGSKTC
jgi:leucyl aminopeptidase